MLFYTEIEVSHLEKYDNCSHLIFFLEFCIVIQLRHLKVWSRPEYSKRYDRLIFKVLADKE